MCFHIHGDNSPALKISQIARLLPVCLLLLITANQAKGFALLNLQWPAGSKVVVQLQLGPTTVALQDGTGTWDGSAADTLAIWNGYLDFISLSSVSGSTVPEASGDGLNSVFFS